jgi:hypothetical protein
MPFLSPGFVDFNDLSKALARAISEALARADAKYAIADRSDDDKASRSV